MKLTSEWKGLTVIGTVERDWEGDGSIPNGLNEVFDVEVETVCADGDDENLYYYLTDDALDACRDALIEGWHK